MRDAEAGANWNDSERAFAVFAVLWAVAAGFEYAGAIVRASALSAVLVVLWVRAAALWVVAKPSSAVRLGMLCVALVAILVAKLPKSPNHGMLVLIASLTIVVAALRVAVAGRSWRISGAALYEAFAPALRWELIALYFWATFHKLNTDFFVMDVSCGPAQVWNLRRILAFLPESQAIQTFGVHGTLLVEAGIPCLLLLRRTRYLGVALALGFHFTLGAAYTGFSAMLFAMLSLFLPREFYATLWKLPASVVGGVRAKLPGALRAGVGRLLGFAAVGLAIAAGVSALWFPNSTVPPTGPPWLSPDFVLVCWLVVGSLVIGTFTWAAWGARPWGAGQRPILGFRHWSVAIGPLLLFAIGLAPHLGLKNTQAFAMFSNLQTGGGSTNHRIIPSSWQRWNHLEDLVTIHESNDPVLAKLIGRSWKNFNYFSTYVVDRGKLERTQRAPVWELPYNALRRRVTDLARAGRTDVAIVYERRGVIRRLDRAEEDPELSSLSWFQRKFQLLRAVPSDRRGYCMW